MTKLCPDTIRACIEALPEPTYVVGEIRDRYEASKAALEALLPDPAEELVREYQLSVPFFHQTFEGFARWLISSGKMKGE